MQTHRLPVGYSQGCTKDSFPLSFRRGKSLVVRQNKVERCREAGTTDKRENKFLYVQDTKGSGTVCSSSALVVDLASVVSPERSSTQVPRTVAGSAPIVSPEWSSIQTTRPLMRNPFLLLYCFRFFGNGRVSRCAVAALLLPLIVI